MEELTMCRICLAEDIRMCFIANTHLEKIYESLTFMPLETKDGRPIRVCYICSGALQNCYRLKEKCLQSEELFTQVLSTGVLQLTKLQEGFTPRLSTHHVMQLSVTRTKNAGCTIEDLNVIDYAEIKSEIEMEEESGLSIPSLYKLRKPRRSSNSKLGRLTPGAKRARTYRINENDGQRNIRLLSDRKRHVYQRAQESTADRSLRLSLDRQRHACKRAQESLADRKLRLSVDRERHASQRAQESPADRSLRLSLDRERHAFKRTQESPADRSVRLLLDRDRHHMQRERETPEEKQVRFDKDLIRHKYLRKASLSSDITAQNPNSGSNKDGSAMHFEFPIHYLSDAVVFDASSTDIKMEPQEEHDTQTDDNIQCSHLEVSGGLDVMKREPDDVETGADNIKLEIEENEPYSADIPARKNIEETDPLFVARPKNVYKKVTNKPILISDIKETVDKDSTLIEVWVELESD